MMKYDIYDNLVKHPFVDDVLNKGIGITKEIEIHKGFKVGAEYKRDPLEEEFYCLQVGHCLCHLLTVVQQMEHTILFMSNFSPTAKMKNAGVNRHTHLLWSVENYIIRTQSVYDRLLILVDRLFHIQNQPNRISHESIVTNTHISRTKIPEFLKPIKRSVKKYYHDRNTIVHQATYLEDELRRIEAYSLMSSHPDFSEEVTEDIKYELKWSVKQYLKKRQREFSRINKNVCIALSDIFSIMHPLYSSKYKELKEKC